MLATSMYRVPELAGLPFLAIVTSHLMRQLSLLPPYRTAIDSATTRASAYFNAPLRYNAGVDRGRNRPQPFATAA